MRVTDGQIIRVTVISFVLACGIIALIKPPEPTEKQSFEDALELLCNRDVDSYFVESTYRTEMQKDNIKISFYCEKDQW